MKISTIQFPYQVFIFLFFGFFSFFSFSFASSKDDLPSGVDKKKNQAKKSSSGQDAQRNQQRAQRSPRNRGARMPTSVRIDAMAPPPYSERVNEAIYASVNKILSQQREDGSWDTSGGFTGGQARNLNQLADQVIESTILTSMCGLALRRHAEIDPERIEPALEKAARFVMQQIERGRLSTDLMYACWRYVFGLKFITSEYRATEDPVLRQQLRETAEKMVESIKEMQMVTRGEEASALPLTEYLKPAHLGLVVKNGEQGGAVIAQILPGGAGEKAGLQAGDLLLTVDGANMHSFYDYYTKEIELIDGDEVKVEFKRGDQAREVTVTVPSHYPGSLGIRCLHDSFKDNIYVSGFDELSHSDDVGVEIDDVLLSINGVSIRSLQDFERVEKSFYAGHKAKLKVLRDKEEHTFEIPLVPRDQANFRIQPQEEDKENKDGVVVRNFFVNSCSKEAGIQLKDRIVRIDHVPVMGLDHFSKLEEALWANKKVDVEVERPDGERKTVTVTLDSKTEINKSLLRGYHGISFPPTIRNTRRRQAPIVADVESNSPAERVGIQKGDRVLQVNGEKITSLVNLYNTLFNKFVGDKITILIERQQEKGEKEQHEYQFAMERQLSGWSVSKEDFAGGWNYYPFVGGSNTFVTASILMTLLEVREHLHIDISNELLEKAVKVIEYTRVKDSRAIAETYDYDTRLATKGDFRGHLGRLPGAELACILASEAGVIAGDRVRTQEHLVKALQLWLDYRHELDRVKNFPGTHDQRNYMNAAYYWLFSHRNAAAATTYIGDPLLRERLRYAVLNALMQTYIWRNSQWIGHRAFGPLTATSQALIALGDLKETLTPRIADTHPKLKPALDLFQKARYGEAFLKLQQLESEDETIQAAIATLQGFIGDRWSSRQQAIEKMWSYDPEVALKWAQNTLDVFKGYPGSEKLGQQMEQWKKSPVLADYRAKVKAIKEIVNTKDYKDPFLKREDSEAFIEKMNLIAIDDPESRARQLAEREIQLLRQSYEGGGSLGFTPDPRYNGNRRGGVRVLNVLPNNAVARAGIVAGDIIHKVNGESIQDLRHLIRVFEDKKPFEKVDVLLNDHKSKGKREVTLELGRRLLNNQQRPTNRATTGQPKQKKKDS